MKELLLRFIMYSIFNIEMYYINSMGAMVVGMGIFAIGAFTLNVICLIVGFTLMGTGVVLLACGEAFRRIGDHLYEKYQEEVEEKEDE
tara:strand:+ start:5000 stop:5263 length:264 start_codon:yes stop_codon:yes gene_type:complete